MWSLGAGCFIRVSGVQGECRTLGKQGWWGVGVGESVASTQKSIPWPILRFAKITLTACGGGMWEARVWRKESNLEWFSFFFFSVHKTDEWPWELQSQNVGSVSFVVTQRPTTHRINRCSFLRGKWQILSKRPSVPSRPPLPTAASLWQPSQELMSLVLPLSSFLGRKVTGGPSQPSSESASFWHV